MRSESRSAARLSLERLQRQRQHPIKRLPLGRAFLRLVAVRAVDRSILTRDEWHLGLATTARACCHEHLTLRPSVAATTGVASLLSTAGASLWVLVASGRVKFLIGGAEYEGLPALHTRKLDILIDQFHTSQSWSPSLSRAVVTSGTRSTRQVREAQRLPCADSANSIGQGTARS